MQYVFFMGITLGLLGGMDRAISAEPFAGFSTKNHRYLHGADRICDPVLIPRRGAAVDAAPRCKRESKPTVLQQKFRIPELLHKSEQPITVQVRGTVLQARDRASSHILFSWTSGEPVRAVRGTFVSPDRRMVAVEYVVGVGAQRSVRCVGFLLPLQPSESLKKARRFARNGQSRRALRAYQQTLRDKPNFPEGLFGVAVQAANLRQKEQALRSLEALAKLPGEEGILWLLEARNERAFTGLRMNVRFRNALRLDVPAKQRTVYERLLGDGGHWEQQGTPCERAGVNLNLTVRPATFRLKIHVRCQTDRFTSKHQGRWTAKGSTLQLLFPNDHAREERVSCKIKMCSDPIEEDCLLCTIDKDLSALLRTVRR